jgi:S1/P1 Nuclease
VATRAAFLACFLALTPMNQALSWGSNGHSIIAEIAQHRLHPQVFARIEDLLGRQASLGSVASWADDIAQKRPDTINWHFVNIPYEATNYDPSRDCRPTPKGDCIINAIKRSRATLQDRFAPKQQRTESLMFLVHLMGDIHQPLHTIDHNDAGGNKVVVNFFGTPMSLHIVWDVGLIEKRTYDWGEYVRILERGWLWGKDICDLHRGNPVDWALQTHTAAVEVAYAVPEDLQLGDAYYRRSLPTLDQQLALGGIRLARVLNEVFGHEGYIGKVPPPREPL